MTGEYTANSTISTLTILAQTGDYLSTTFFTINITTSIFAVRESEGNSVTGDYSITYGFDSTDTDTHAVGNDANGSYDFDKEAYTSRTWEEVGNTILGDYTITGYGDANSTATEFNTYAGGSADFVEVITENFTITITGNQITGDSVSDDSDGIRTTSLVAHTYDASGDYTITQNTLGTFWRNTVFRADGTYEATEGASDDYTVIQSGDHGTTDFLLTITGTNSYSVDTNGDSVSGLYTTTKIGTDEYTMEESGTITGGVFGQTILGTDDYTMTDIGNSATGEYTRTIEGDVDYDRTTTGASALPTDDNIVSYTWTQTGDPHSGTFNLSQSGTDRYDLLEDFKDISNTQAGQTPGHMNVYPFGQTFVDPGPGRTWGQWFEIIAVAPLEGGVHGGAMLLNSVTFGITPLNGYVEGLIHVQDNASNFGGYGVANGAAAVGVVAAETAGGIVVVRAIGGAAGAARAGQLAARVSTLTTRGSDAANRITTSQQLLRGTFSSPEARTLAEKALSQAQRELIEINRLLGQLGAPRIPFPVSPM